MLYYITLYYIILHYITLYHIISHYITLYYIILYYIILHYITLYYIILHYIILHYITLYHIILHYITLHYIILHYITLHYILHCKFYCISWQHILKTRQSFLKTYTRSFIYQSNIHLDCIARKLWNGSKLHVTATNHTYESFGTSSVYNISGYSYHDEQKHAGN